MKIKTRPVQLNELSVEAEGFNLTIKTKGHKIYVHYTAAGPPSIDREFDLTVFELIKILHNG